MYIYGCYSQKDIESKIPEMTIKKYEKELTILKSIFERDVFNNESVKNKKRPKFSYDRYDNIANFLIKAYKIKNYTHDNMRIYNDILRILYFIDKNIKDIDLKINSPIDLLADTFDKDIFYNGDANKYLTIKNCLKELIDIGFVSYNEQNEKYSITYNFLDDLEKEEINSLMQGLYFFRGFSPLSSQSIFAIETLKEYSNFKKDYENIEDYVDVEDVYLFKDNHFNNILNDNDIYIIIQAINQNKMLEVEYIHNIKNETIITINKCIPLKIFTDYKYGRQYLLCFNEDKKTPTNIFINKINNIKIINTSFKKEDYSSTIELLNKSYSLNQLYDLKDPLKAEPILIEVIFDFNENVCKNLELNERVKLCENTKYTVELTKRQGKIEDISPTQFKYSIEILSPTEIIPYIRSFAPYGNVVESEYHNLKIKIDEDWSNLKKAYGII